MFNFLISAAKTSEYTDNILHSLSLFWKGMLAVSLVIGIIFAITFLMTFFSPDAIKERVIKKQAKENQKNEKE